MEHKRGKVWLGVSGLVKSDDGKWLVVKKRYGGLKGMWSLPAGFVDEGETADEAVVREIKEETGINAVVKGLIGLRTGVIREEISDNMVMFLLEPKGEAKIKHQEKELYEAKYMKPEDLLHNEDTSALLRYLITQNLITTMPCMDGLNPGDQFGYTTYRLFL